MLTSLFLLTTLLVAPVIDNNKNDECEDITAPIETVGRDTIFLKRCIGFSKQVNHENTVYIIEYSYNLKGQVITIPNGCEICLRGGSLRNGSLVGRKTKLTYKNEFLENVYLFGSFVTENVPVDTDIFIDVNYGTHRIESMLCVYGKDDKVVFSKHTFTDIGTIHLNRNVDIDFSGSTIELHLDKNGLPTPFVYTEERRETDKSFLDVFKLRNATIVGNEKFEYDGTVWPKSLHHGIYRRCIQLFKVDDVEIENVRFEHIEAGTSGDYHKDARERYELSIVAVMYYNLAKINGCVLHDCFGDNLIKMVPNVISDNMAIVSHCTSFRNYTGLVSITDGRCRVYGNNCKDFNSSAMNLFVYDSEVYNNYFENSLRSDCIDLSEDGTRIVHDVKIYDNIGIDINVFCSVSGDDIYVYNNRVKSKNSSLVCVDGTRQPNPSLVNNNAGLSSKRVIRIYKNEIEGGGIVTSGVNSTLNTCERYIDTLYVENNNCKKESEIEREYSHPVFLFNCKKAIIKGNHLKGLSKNPAGKGSAAFICSYNILQDDVVFDNDVEIVGNMLEYDTGSIGLNAIKAMYLLRNNIENKNFNIKIDAHDNTIIGADKPLREVYISSEVGKRRIQSIRNVGTVSQ